MRPSEGHSSRPEQVAFDVLLVFRGVLSLQLQSKRNVIPDSMAFSLPQPTPPKGCVLKRGKSHGRSPAWASSSPGTRFLLWTVETVTRKETRKRRWDQVAEDTAQAKQEGERGMAGDSEDGDTGRWTGAEAEGVSSQGSHTVGLSHCGALSLRGRLKMELRRETSLETATVGNEIRN